MQSFDNHPAPDEQHGMTRRGSDAMQRMRDQELEIQKQRKKSLTIVVIFFIFLLCLRLLERPERAYVQDEAREQAYEDEKMEEEDIAAKLMQAMMNQGQEQEQYRLVPSEMIPGFPPGGMVKVRVRADHGPQMGGTPLPPPQEMGGGMQVRMLPGGRMVVMRAAPMHDPNAFRTQMPMQDPNAEAHAQMAALMSQGIPPQIAAQMVLQTMADGAGDHGQTGGMERTETPELLTLQFHVPGHHILESKTNFDASEKAKEHEAGEQVNPLDIKLLDRTVLIRGTTRKEAPWMGDGVFVSSSFQRAVWLPANAIMGKIECDYGRKSGNLVIKIPKDASKPEKDDADEDHPEEDGQRVEKIRKSFQSFQERVKAMNAADQADKEGVRGPGAVHGVKYDDLKGRLEQMHEDGTGLQLEDSNPHLNAISKDSVEYLGCFAAWDLPRNKKELPAHAASSFSRAAVAAIQDAQEDKTDNLEDEESQYFFAMARHDAPHKTGAAFTFRRFDHEINNRHGVMCGNHCDDDGTWFCGALGDAEHHSDKTEQGVDSAMFAVYALTKPKDISTKALDAAQAADHAAESDEHPTWRLVDDFNGGSSKVEFIIPKESNFLKQEDNKVAVFFKDEKLTQETVKVVLPMKIDSNWCEFGSVTDGSATRVVSCSVANNGFQSLKINVKEEL